MFFVLKREERAKKLTTGTLGFGFWPKNGGFVTQICFLKMGCWNPFFKVFFWGRTFWTKLSKKWNFGTPPKNRKFWLVAERLVFGISWFFFLFFPLFFFFLFFVAVFIFFWRVKGQVRWPKGPPHLALNPPYF